MTKLIFIGIALAAGAVAGWAGSAGGRQSPKAGIEFPAGKLIELTYPFNERTIYWPTAKTFKLEKVTEGETDQGYFYAANNFEAAEHGGTHLDAPVHFARDGHKADEIALRRLTGRSVVVDVSQAALRDRDYRVAPADFAAYERRHGRIPSAAIVLIRTGYGRYWPNRENTWALRSSGNRPCRSSTSPACTKPAPAGWCAGAVFAPSASTPRASTTDSRSSLRATGSWAPQTCRCSRISPTCGGYRPRICS
jgi:kynurenine formamidase